MTTTDIIQLPAIAFKQGKTHQLFTFVVDGKLLERFCAVSRLARHQTSELHGYQRPEAISHIGQITDFLESYSPMLPNAIIVAFDKSVKFRSDPRSSGTTGTARSGLLEIQLHPIESEERKPGWIVDGQQRAAAIRNAKIGQFPVCVVAFIAESIEEQREQFILVNATKPLPRGLIYELLPETHGKLPLALERNRTASRLLARLNSDEDSPMKGLIRTATCGTGVVADNSVLRMLKNSMSDGVLFTVPSFQAQLSLLKAYWGAVAMEFASAWGLKPKRSRLMHGAGFVAMGLLMDTICSERNELSDWTSDLFSDRLQIIHGCCHWTSGQWPFPNGEQLWWNQVQNVGGHVQLLTTYLQREYRTKSTNIVKHRKNR